MNKSSKHKAWLYKKARSQQERFSAALDPAELPLMDFDVEEWMQFTYQLAKKVNYFHEEDSEKAKGTWENFFKQKGEITHFIKNLEDGETPPHLALFVCFLFLLKLPKESFNQLTKRHLEYYYSEVLQIKRKPPVPDKVFVVFDLAKNIIDALISSDNLLDAGKDANGKRRFYSLLDELVVNQAIVTDLKNVYHHTDNNNSGLFASQMANSLDGLGKGLSEDNPQWYPFGHPLNSNNFPKLPKPRLGFILSSEVLRMAEGSRELTVEISLKPTNVYLTDISKLLGLGYLSVQLTGEKEWVSGNLYIVTVDTDSKPNQITLVFKIDPSAPAIANYNEKVHELNLRTDKPTALFELNWTDDNSYNIYAILSQIQISNIDVNVKVENISSLKLENDQGVINPKKPFFPFGTSPVVKSNFQIDYPEVFAKKWSKIELKSEWKNAPDGFKNHYFSYRTEHLSKPLNKSNLIYIIQDNFNNYKPIFAFRDQQEKQSYPTIKEIDLSNLVPQGPKNLVVNSDSHFTANQLIRDKNVWIGVNGKNKSLFEKSASVYIKNFVYGNKSTLKPTESGPLRISLIQSFYHSIYPKIYALAMAAEEPNDIPNEPYTPMMDHITMEYTANAQWKDATHVNASVDFFHLHPFGVSSAKTGDSEPLVPKYDGGELYIGLENAKPLQQISLLFQLLEGTENPLAQGYVNNEGITWSVLVNNTWQLFEIIKNDTDNFLKSGIFTFTLPADATNNNTLMSSGKFWLKAHHTKSFDAVCQMVGVHSQAAIAEFQNQDNSLEHLLDALPPKTISKLMVRLAEVKKISQPYPSFGGRFEETDEHYYIRVSERLRHKNRAITMWDYEHLVLEQFPKIHKVKSLNHTSPTSFNSPGHTALVVVPNTVNQSVHDIFQPRVSQAELNEIVAFLNTRNSMHMQVHVLNPDYEEVKIVLKVQFKKGFDFEFYKKLLDEDLKKLLSPWAFSETASVKFGTRFYRSQVIHYIEKLEYVDFIADFNMRKKIAGVTGEGELIQDAIPSNPKSILVSDKGHSIDRVDKSCEQNSNSNLSEPC